MLWQKYVFVESHGSCFKWGTGLRGGEREGTQNTKWCLFYGPCCPSAVWGMEKAHVCQAEQKLCLGLWRGSQLRYLFKTGPTSLSFLFYTPWFWCYHNVDTFIFLSSVNQHPCRTEEVEGANWSKAGTRYTVILIVFFLSLLYEFGKYCFHVIAFKSA